MLTLPSSIYETGSLVLSLHHYLLSEYIKPHLKGEQRLALGTLAMATLH